MARSLSFLRRFVWVWRLDGFGVTGAGINAHVMAMDVGRNITRAGQDVWEKGHPISAKIYLENLYKGCAHR